jgi:hypothetical protein
MGYDYGGPLAGKILADTARLMKQAYQGEADEAAVIALINATGDFTGLPTTQALRTYRGYMAWDEGDAPITAILFGPPQRD